VSPFRSKYDYDNNLYIVAGEVIRRISGRSWEDFVRTRILDALKMESSGPSFIHLKDSSNVIDPHAEVEGEIRVVGRTVGQLQNAAGGMYSSISDLCKWVMTLLNEGVISSGSQPLISKKTHHDLWTPQTLMPVTTTPPYNSHFAAYGLGFRLADVKGYLEVSHTGGLAGMVTQITMFPELKLGIIVLTNQQVGAAFSAISNQIKDGYLGVTGINWLVNQRERNRKANEDAAKITKEVWDEIGKNQSASGNTKINMEQFTGTYRDPWLGDIIIQKKDNKLLFRSVRSPGLKGELIFYRGQCFVVKWFDRSFDADAFVLFQTGYDGEVSGFTMKAISPLTDFSFDFHDLDFERINISK